MDEHLAASAGAAFLLGIGAGLAVAVPLGAIGVLLLREGVERGWRVAAGAAMGVATVDLVYATLATLAGTWVATVLVGHETPVRLAGAAVLALVAAHGVWVTLHARHELPRREGAGIAGDAPTDAAPSLAFARFVALTAFNPMTALTFAAIAVGLGARLAGWPERTAFVIGTGSGSLAWQLALAGAGAAVGARATASVRTALALAGYAVVGAFAVVLGLSA